MSERSGKKAIAVVGKNLRRTVMQHLESPDLGRDGRIAVYAIGAGEAMLLERTQPQWRSSYPRILALGPLHLAGCQGDDRQGSRHYGGKVIRVAASMQLWLNNFSGASIF